MRYAIWILLALMAAAPDQSNAQPVPAAEENIPYLVTFGANSLKSWGDDDFCQSFFFVVPKTTVVPIYIRVFDPDCSGTIDEAKGDNTQGGPASHIKDANRSWRRHCKRHRKTCCYANTGHCRSGKNLSKTGGRRRKETRQPTGTSRGSRSP